MYLMSLTVHLKTRWQILSQFLKIKKKEPIRTHPFVQIYTGCQLFAECPAASIQPLMYSKPNLIWLETLFLRMKKQTGTCFLILLNLLNLTSIP